MKKLTKKNPILPSGKGLEPDMFLSKKDRFLKAYFKKNPGSEDLVMRVNTSRSTGRAAAQLKAKERKTGMDGSIPSTSIEKDIKRQELLERYKKSGGLAGKKSTKPAPMTKPKMVKKKKN